MATHLCQLRNNADFAVRVVTISQFGQSDRVIQALETIVTQFQDGRKVLIAWRANTGELLENHIINVTRSSLFKIFREAQETQTLSDGTVVTRTVPAPEIGRVDAGEPINQPIDPLGPPT
jgi:hypothetical protein